MVLEVAAHGVRLLRMTAVPPPPPPPPPPTPAGFQLFRQHGYWHNTAPCNGNFSHCTAPEHVSVAQCAANCMRAAPRKCLGFEVFQPLGVSQCYLFFDTLAAPFTPNPESWAYVRASQPVAYTFP